MPVKIKAGNRYWVRLPDGREVVVEVVQPSKVQDRWECLGIATNVQLLVPKRDFIRPAAVQ